MTAVMDCDLAPQRVDAELVEDTTPFFAPTSTDMLDGLLGEYQQRRREIDQLAGLMRGDLGNVVHYFIEGNAGNENLHRSLYIDRLFNAEGAVHQLDAAYWSKALQLTDVYECMPQNRKNDWRDQLQNPGGRKAGRWDSKGDIAPLPHFEEDTVRRTIADLLRMRATFLAEKVDGIFRALSGEHVTNAPEAFGKRMIIAYIVGSYGMASHDRVGYIHDLRCVIARFMGREEPENRGSTDRLVDTARRQSGKWVYADGGALKLRVYKIGTGHMEVHPDMAWRLNQILAHLYPLAIPASFRQRPKRRPKDVPLLGRPLPFKVLEMLSVRQYNRDASSLKTFVFQSYADKQGAAFDEACRVLASLGGTPRDTRMIWDFDYVIADVFTELLTTGCIPDQQAHQFYPTPERLARLCAELAEIQPGERVLEPSAGQGDLAQALPHVTTCVEVSALHCAVLRARGFHVEQADFLHWFTPDGFDAIVMNPPFADGRAQAHVAHAATMVKEGGRLVAIVSASARGTHDAWLGSGWACSWSAVFEGEFAGTSAAVAILKAVRR